MITILFHVTVKAEREAGWPAMLAQLTESSRTEDEGCITYQFYQQQNSPRDYVLHEQWRNGDALRAHVQRLQRVLGPAPERGLPLPVALLDYFEAYQAIPYDPVP